MRFMIQLSILIGVLAFVGGCQYLPESNWFQSRPHDTTITENVSLALRNNPELSPFTFHVETSEGVVYLSGYVKTIKQSDMAGEIASHVTGVRTVENNIIVRK